MKRLVTTFVVFGACAEVCAAGTASAFPDRAEIVARLKKYPLKPYFPPASDRAAWESLPADVRKQLIAEAEKSAKAGWPQLTARDYMRFRRNGDRLAYEAPYFRRRSQLIDLVVGECCEHSGRFMDDIVEGLWQILSEPVWCAPAHEYMPIGDVLPDPSRFKVDLFNASTGKILTDTLQLLEPELAKVSPMLVQRVKMEVLRRVIEPAEKLNDETAWWFCGRNNWTPWCSSNLVGSAICLLDKEPERLADFIVTYLTISRRFYDRYPADGGCGEGPHYWQLAVGKYFQLLDQLDHRLHLQGRLFKDEKLIRMCEYVARMNLSGDWFLNTNDAVPKPVMPPGFLTLIAQKCGSPGLAGLARRLPQAKKIERATELDRFLAGLLTPVPEGADAGGFSAVDLWPDTGIAILRQMPEHPEKGTVVSIKGGNNAESHNHLDLGNFTLMRRNKPLIVDVGAGVYTAQTFSGRRYQIWHIGAEGHNPPRFAEVGQEYGKEYTAKVSAEGDSLICANLDRAYPASAGVRKLTRSVRLDRRTGNVEVTDTAELAKGGKAAVTLYTAVEPVAFDGTSVRWKLGTLTAEGLAVVKVSEETRMDARLKEGWGRLWRIDLAGDVNASGCWKLRFDFSEKDQKKN